MIPRVRAAMVLAVLTMPGMAAGFSVGNPGAPSPAFSLRGSIAVGYSSVDLDTRLQDVDPDAGRNERLRDDVERVAIFGRLSLMLADWLEVYGGIGGADADRDATRFDSGLGLSGGMGVRFYPMLQDKFGINIGLGGAWLRARNEGTVPNPDPQNSGTRVDATLKEQAFRGELILSRNFRAWTAYGGILTQFSEFEQSNIPDADNDTRWGLFAGVDYFVNPVVFFSVEASNFHSDLISAAIGVVIAPQ